MICSRCGITFQPQDEIYAMMSGEWLCADCYISQEDHTGTHMALPDMVYNIMSHIKNLDDAREEFEDEDH